MEEEDGSRLLTSSREGRGEKGGLVKEANTLEFNVTFSFGVAYIMN